MSHDQIRPMTYQQSKQLVLFIVFTVSGVLAVLYTVHELIDVWLVVFAGVLFAVGLHAAAAKLHDVAGMPTGVALALVTILLTLLFVLIIWVAGPAFISGIDRLEDQLPTALKKIQQIALKVPYLAGAVEEVVESTGSSDSGSGVLSRIGTAVSTAIGLLSQFTTAITILFVISIIALYTSADPSRYVNGVLKLFPDSKRKQVQSLLQQIRHDLTWWLIGRFSSMAVVGVLTALGLFFLGVDSAITLAVIAALLSFIPNIGPVLALIPAALIGIADGPQTAMLITGLYVFVQIVESYLVTPLIQQRCVSMAPAAVITIQLAAGATFGLLGLFLATPIAVAFRVLLDKLWVEGVLRKTT